MKKQKVKWFAVLLLAELCFILICAGIIALRQNAVYTCAPELFSVSENGMSSQTLILPRGVYRVELRYSCQEDQKYFANIEKVTQQGKLFASGEHLSPGLGYTSFDLWVKERTEVRLVIPAGDGGLKILGFSIYETYGDVTRIIVMAMLLFLVTDIGFIIWRKRDIFQRWKAAAVVIFLITLTASVPAFAEHLYPGSDVTYHLLRIDNIKDGLLSGQFPVRIDPAWLWGHGYASSICYGETLLYLPAMMRLLGFTLQESYMTFLCFLNLGTCLISFFSFKGIFQSQKLGLFCSAVYTLSIYRLYKMYSWSALGEVQAMFWLPLILYAVYCLLAEEVGQKGYGKQWIALAVGFSGIVQCHVLTCELTVFFLAVTCIICWKRLFRRATFLAFVKAVAGVCALSAWFVVPFLEYLLKVDMVIGHVSERRIQQEGLFPANLFFGFFHRGVGRNLAADGMVNMEALGVGMTITAAAGLLCLLWFWGYLKGEDKTLAAAGKIATVLGITAMCMSLAIFPWDAIQSQNSVLRVLVSSIQYPNRFLMTATLLLTFAGGVSLVCVRRQFGYKIMRGTAASFLVITMITALFYLNSIMKEAGTLYMYDAKGMGTGYLSGAEYLRYGSDTSLYSYSDFAAGEEVDILEAQKEWLNVDLYVKNNGSEDGYVDLPLQNYPGYVAKTEEGRRLEICDGDNKDLRVIIPADWEGTVKVGFCPPWYWRGAEIVSLLSAAMLMIYYLHNLKIRRPWGNAQ